MVESEGEAMQDSLVEQKDDQGEGTVASDVVESKATPKLSDCLIELREMFPGEPDSFVDAWLSTLRNQPKATIRVRGAHFFGDTLGECLSKVRDWKRSSYEASHSAKR